MKRSNADPDGLFLNPLINLI